MPLPAACAEPTGPAPLPLAGRGPAAWLLPLAAEADSALGLAAGLAGPLPLAGTCMGGRLFGCCAGNCPQNSRTLPRGVGLPLEFQEGAPLPPLEAEALPLLGADGSPVSTLFGSRVSFFSFGSSVSIFGLVCVHFFLVTCVLCLSFLCLTPKHPRQCFGRFSAVGALDPSKHGTASNTVLFVWVV